MVFVLSALAMIAPVRADDSFVVRVPAAGTLRSAISEIGAAFSSATGVRVFLAYCSAGAAFKKDMPAATIIDPSNELANGADYGLTLLPTENESAAAFASYILSQDGQEILSRNGFDAPLALPEQR